MRQRVSFKSKVKDKLSKDIKRTYRKAYFIREYNSNNDSINEEPEFKDKKDEVIITIILKKALCKIFKYKWLINIDIILYMTNDLNIYRSLLELYYRVV
jgi:hypothetical protein